MSIQDARTQSPTQPRPDWYPDPYDREHLRYWDGERWTSHVTPSRPASVSPPQPSAWTAPPGEYRPPEPPSPSPNGQGPSDVAPKRSGREFSNAGIVCGALAFLLLPIVFGPAGLILGAVAKSKGDERAVVAMTVSALGLVVGMIIGAMVASSY